MSGTLGELLRWMDDEVGVVEVPAHSNHVRLRNGKDLWVDYYGYQPPSQQAPWCALFQSAADIENGTPMPEIQSKGFHGFVGVDAGRAWFKANNLLVPQPKVGYLAFYHEHVGRVRAYSGGQSFMSLEGNEGDGVRLVTRYLSELVGGFGVREYAGGIPRPEHKEEFMSEAKFVTPSPPSGQGVWLVDAGTKEWMQSMDDVYARVNIGIVKDPTIYPYPPATLRRTPDVPGSAAPKEEIKG